MHFVAQDRCHRIGQSKPVVVYRLLTAGSVEIEMMERQISKKKLERLAVYGGDYRQAGKRAGSELTLSTIRKLLEDDVKNLGRMSSSSALASLTDTNDDVVRSNEPGVSGRYAEIGQKELSMIMDRDLLFVKTTKSTTTATTTVSAKSTGTASSSNNNTSDNIRGPTPTSIADTASDDLLSSRSPTNKSPKSTKLLESSSNSADKVSSASKKTSVKGVKVSPSSTTKTEPNSVIQDTSTVETQSKSAPVYGGGGTAHEVLGCEEDRMVTYEVSATVPLEGQMYDIISIDPNQISGMLQGINA